MRLTAVAERRILWVAALLFALLFMPMKAVAQEIPAPTAPSIELARDVRLRIQRLYETLLPLRQAAIIKTAMASELCDRDDPAPDDWCDRMRREAAEARAAYEAELRAYERRHADALAAARAQPLWRELAASESTR